MTQDFDRRIVVTHPDAGRSRLQAEADRMADIKARATPPVQMRAAPVAPARGVQQLVRGWEVMPGGTRRRDGDHWITPTGLDVINRHERAKDEVAKAGGDDPAVETARGKRDLFSPSQVAMARRYVDLVEWRRSSGVSCGKLEAGYGGSDPGLFIDRYIDAGAELARMVAAIGPGMALAPKYGRDTDNVRRAIPVRAAVDAVVLLGRSLSWVLKSHKWQPTVLLRRDLVTAIRGALDRMMG